MESNNSNQALDCKELQAVLCLNNTNTNSNSINSNNTNSIAVAILITEAVEAEVEEVATEEVI
jgi:hypothetical protein